MLIEFLKWQFFYSVYFYFKAFFAFLRFGVELFSIPVVIKTMFAPWRRLVFEYPTEFNPIKLLDAMAGNLISRVLGFVLRVFLICVWLIFEITLLILGVVLFFVWFFMPILALIFLYIGFLTLFR